MKKKHESLEVMKYLEFGRMSKQRSAEGLEGGQGFVTEGNNISVTAINTLYPANFIALLEFIESKPRGNHYHREKEEVILVLRGRVLAEFRLPEADKTQVSRTLAEGEYVRIIPGCVHTFTAVEGDAIAIEYANTAYIGADIITL